jgi:hypothetical protein
VIDPPAEANNYSPRSSEVCFCDIPDTLKKKIL